MNKASRIETDSMGPIEVPAQRYYGAQTARSLIHFAIGQDRMRVELIHAFALLRVLCSWLPSIFRKFCSMRQSSKGCKRIVAIQPKILYRLDRNLELDADCSPALP